LRVGFLGEGKGKKKKNKRIFKVMPFSLSLSHLTPISTMSAMLDKNRGRLFEPQMPVLESLISQNQFNQIQTEKVWIIFEKIGNIQSSTFCFLKRLTRCTYSKMSSNIS
jgi:hypothetical protein